MALESPGEMRRVQSRAHALGASGQRLDHHDRAAHLDVAHELGHQARQAKNTAESKASNSSAEETVYITKSGKAYHKSESCSGLRSSKNISAVTLEEAVEMGRKPCSICYG